MIIHCAHFRNPQICLTPALQLRCFSLQYSQIETIMLILSSLSLQSSGGFQECQLPVCTALLRSLLESPGKHFTSNSLKHLELNSQWLTSLFMLFGKQKDSKVNFIFPKSNLPIYLCFIIVFITIVVNEVVKNSQGDFEKQ